MSLWLGRSALCSAQELCQARQRARQGHGRTCTQVAGPCGWRGLRHVHISPRGISNAAYTCVARSAVGPHHAGGEQLWHFSSGCAACEAPSEKEREVSGHHARLGACLTLPGCQARAHLFLTPHGPLLLLCAPPGRSSGLIGALPRCQIAAASPRACPRERWLRATWPWSTWHQRSWPPRAPPPRPSPRLRATPLRLPR